MAFAAGRDGGSPAFSPAAGQGPDLVVQGVLGEGGMGRVLLARQRSLGRDVAVKVLHAEAPSPAMTAALLTEGLISGSLEHPSVVPVHALGLDDAGRPMLVMKRIEGTAWKDLLDDPQHPLWARLPRASDRLAAHLQILMSVCNALQLAHSRGVFHRDVKATNVMIGELGEVYLVDWGVALRKPRPGEEPMPWLAHAGAIVGSPSHMAPEMVLGDPAQVDERTDVYLLGSTLYEVLTGRYRHAGATLREALEAAYVSAPPDFPPGVPEGLAELVARATDLSPANRPASALAFRDAIGEHLGHRSSVALAERAAEGLRELRALLSARKPGEPLSRARERFVECRFGFAQALHDWDGNRVARGGLQECVEAMLTLELDEKNAPGARALLAELPEPRPELEERVGALEHWLLDRDARDARLAALEHENDPAVSARARTVAILGFAVVALGIGAYFALAPSTTEPSTRDTLIIGCGVLTLVAVIAVAGRKVFMRNEINRRIIGVVLLLFATLAAHRAIAFRFDERVASILTVDMFLVSAFFAVLGLMGLRWGWWSAALALIGAGTLVAMPERATTLFSAWALAALATAAVLSFRVREPAGGPRVEGASRGGR